MQEIVVTATRYEKSTFEVPMGITVVNRDEIEEKNPRTTAEALRHKAGIWIQKTGHLGGSPILRGFMGNRVIYLFDNIRRNTASIFGGPNSFLQNIDALDIDRIEVVRGPGSVLYGSDAIGGVVNVITNERPIFSKELKYGGRFYTRYGSVDEELSTRVEVFSAYKNFYAFWGGTYRDINDLEGGRGMGTQDPARWREINWDAQLNYKWGKHSFEFFVQDFSRPRGRRFDKPDRVQGSERDLFGLQYKGEGFGKIESVKWVGYYHDQRSYRRKDGKVLDESHRRDVTWGTEVVLTAKPFGGAKLTGGFHFHYDKIKAANFDKGTQDPDVDWYNPAVFLFYEWQVLSRLRLELGLRWDQFILQSQAPPFSKLANSVQDAINNGELSLKDLELDDTTDAVTGGVGLILSLTDYLNAVFHFGRAFRAPNKSDMLRFGQFTFGFNVPTTGLKPESSFTYEAGLRAEHEDFAAAATFFYTEVEDAIVSQPGVFAGKDFIDVNGNGVKDPGEDVFVKSNTSGLIEAWGVELEGKYYLPQKPLEHILGKSALMLYGNFTWIYGRDTGLDEPLDRAFPANGLIGFYWSDHRDPELRRYWLAFEVWMVRRFSRIQSTRLKKDPAFKVDPQDKSSPLLRPDGSVPGFTIFNLRAGMHLTKYSTFTIGVRNLTDKKYRVKDSRIDAPGINFVFSLELRL